MARIPGQQLECQTPESPLLCASIHPLLHRLCPGHHLQSRIVPLSIRWALSFRFRCAHSIYLQSSVTLYISNWFQNTHNIFTYTMYFDVISTWTTANVPSVWPFILQSLIGRHLAGGPSLSQHHIQALSPFHRGIRDPPTSRTQSLERVHPNLAAPSLWQNVPITESQPTTQ